MQLSDRSRSEQKTAHPPESSRAPFPLLGAVAQLKTQAHFIHVRPRDGGWLPELYDDIEVSEAVLDAFRTMKESSKSWSARPCTGMFPRGV